MSTFSPLELDASEEYALAEPGVRIVRESTLLECARCVEVSVKLEHWAMNFGEAAGEGSATKQERHSDKYRIYHGVVASNIPAMLSKIVASMLRQPTELSGRYSFQHLSLLKGVLGAILALLMPGDCREFGSRPARGSSEDGMIRKAAKAMLD